MGADEERRRFGLMDSGHGGWVDSARAWIEGQGELGDFSRQVILDPAVDEILSDVRGLKVLDVGCGEGRYSRKLAGRGAIVTGIDPVREFVDRARNLLESGEYLVGVGESLPFPDEAFDLVLSYLSLIDIPDYRSAISEMIRVTRKGGDILLVLVSNLASCSDGWIKGSDGKKLHRPVDHYMEEFAMELSWSGLNIVNFHRPLSSILKCFFDGGCVVNGFWEPLPRPDHPEYLDEFRAPNFQIIRLRNK